PPDWETDGNDPSEIKDCPEISTVKDYIAAKRLYANVGITYQIGSHPQGKANDVFTVKLEKFGNGDIILEPIILPIGSHQMTSFEIIDDKGNADPSDDQMIYSGVGNTSKYATFVDFAHQLPRCIKLTAEDKLQKRTDPMTVLCAVNALAADFGFVKWETNFIKVYKIPFHVNKCDLYNGHTVAATTVRVYKGTTGGVRPVNPIYTNSIPLNSTTMNAYMISDDMSIDDANEYYWIEIVDNATSNLIDLLEGTITQLKNPGTHPKWDPIYEFIHYEIDGCTGCDGYPNATTWAGETFEGKSIADLLDEGWQNLIYKDLFGHPIWDMVSHGELKIRQEKCSRTIATPVFYIAKAGKFCIEGDVKNIAIELIPATQPVYFGEDDAADYLFNNKPGCEKPKKECIEICEPGCYRIQMTIDGTCCPILNPEWVNLEKVTLTRMQSCEEQPR
ncbi:MAG: hypothetical protein RRZ66_06375, partial [Bacteroidales bacterium]